MSFLNAEKLVAQTNENLRSYSKQQLTLWLTEQLYYAFAEARKGKTRTINEQLFEENRDSELYSLACEIINQTYEPQRSVAFIITNPTPREIFAASFRDRVVHHFLIQQTGDFWDKRLSPRSFSCRNGKGTLYGIHCLENDIRSVSHNYSRPAWVMKIDIQGYFMSLSRQYLFDRVCWGLDKQFPFTGPLYNICRYLWKKVLFDNPLNGVKLKGNISNWDILPRSKSMFYSKDGRGIVIGNLTSQWVSNMALDPFDRYVTFVLGVKHYGRYVDDAYFVASSKEELLAIRPTVNAFIDKLGLTVHPRKFFLQPATHGIPFLGVVIYPGHTVLGRRFKRNMWHVRTTIENEGLSDKNRRSMEAYRGLAVHYNYKTIYQKCFYGVQA